MLNVLMHCSWKIFSRNHGYDNNFELNGTGRQWRGTDDNTTTGLQMGRKQ